MKTKYWDEESGAFIDYEPLLHRPPKFLDYYFEVNGVRCRFYYWSIFYRLMDVVKRMEVGHLKRYLSVPGAEDVFIAEKEFRSICANDQDRLFFKTTVQKAQRVQHEVWAMPEPWSKWTVI